MFFHGPLPMVEVVLTDNEFLQQLSTNTGYSFENLLGAMADSNGWKERERERERESTKEIRARSVI